MIRTLRGVGYMIERQHENSIAGGSCAAYWAWLVGSLILSAVSYRDPHMRSKSCSTPV